MKKPVTALVVALIVAAGALIYFFRTQSLPHRSPETDSSSQPVFDTSSSEKQVAKKLEMLRQEVQRNPNSAAKWGLLAKNLHIHGFKEQALLCYKKAAKLDPNEFQWPYYAAILLEDSGSKESMLWYERAGRIRINYSPLLIHEAQLLLNEGNRNDAKAKFRKASEIDSKCWSAYLGLAQIAVLEGQMGEAQTLLKEALELNPKYSEAYSLLAMIYRRLGEPEKAENVLNITSRLPQKTTAPDPVYADLVSEGVSSYWHRVRGRANLENGSLDHARMEFEAALQAKPDADAYTNLGAIQERSGKLQEAIELYRKSISLNPTALAWYNLGSALGKLGRYPESIEASSHAISLQKNYADAYFNVGVAYFKMEQWQQAVSSLRETVRIKPDHAFAHYALAQCYLNLGDRKSELQELSVLRKLNPDLVRKLER